MNNRLKCWILADSRSGSNNQALALAQDINANYKLINIEYNFFGKFLNWLLPWNFIQIKSPDIRSLLEREVPDVLISASRRTALVACAIKKLYPSAKIIQIHKPDLPLKHFDLVVIPQHDKNVDNSSGNIIRVIGALNNIERRILETEDSFFTNFPNITSAKYVGVLVGGNTKSFSYTEDSCRKFYEVLNQISKANKVKFLITFSRRTPDILKEVFNNFRIDGHTLYDPENHTFNPFPAMLANTRFTISTCDSISMVSEVASTGKSIYIYMPEGFKSQKHLTFIYQLADLGIAKILENESDVLQEYNYNRLNETVKVAEYINSNILCVK